MAGSQGEQVAEISDREKQLRKQLVEKAKVDLERLSTGKIEKTQKFIKESGIMKLFDEFIVGKIP